MAEATQRLTTALAGRYRIERELGAGGMATVYLAEDLKHERKVAVKVLKPELAAVLGAERFVAEIKTTAALQHPHILPLFDSGEADGFLYYVMPFVDGETLRARLDRDRQLGVEEAVRMTCEIAEALQYAHEHGVIHRDIKPENILLANGRPMVADFGIALAVSAAAGGRMTETGLSLGTPHYMSPEQATAEREITARSDVYSLASVCYEMLAGEPPHMGTSAQQIIMKIIAEPVAPVTKLRKTVPPQVAGALAQALEKLPADRFTTAKEFAAALQGQGAVRPTGAGATTARMANGAAQGRWRRVALATSGLALVSLATAAWALSRGGDGSSDAAPIEFTYNSGASSQDRPDINISRDGRFIVEGVTDSTGNRRIVLRDLARATLRSIPGTEGGYDPTVSPDGEWLLFSVDATTRKLPIDGGPSTLVADSTDGASWWGENGTILVSRLRRGLWRYSMDGSPPEVVTTLDSARNEFAHWRPEELPGGEAAIFNSYSAPLEESWIEAVDYASGKRTVLVKGAIHPRYVRTGHLLYSREGTVFAVPFDPKQLRVTGPERPVLENVAWKFTNGLGGYDISDNGTLVYLRASEFFVPRRVAWVDRQGNETPIFDERAGWSEPRLSPDQRWLAMSKDEGQQVWLYDFSRRVLTQLSRSKTLTLNAAWMPDSRELIVTSETPVYDLFRAGIDGSPWRPFKLSAFDKMVSDVSPDGRTVAYVESASLDRLLLAPIDGGEEGPLDDRPVSQRTAAFSPDGRWIAYAEAGEGRREVFVKRVDGVPGRRQVSSDGGDQPLWTNGGREIVYRRGSGVHVVSFDPASGEVGTPTVLFSKPDVGRSGGQRTHGYDVTADGARFAMVLQEPRPDRLPVVVVLNWRQVLREQFGR